MSKQPSNPDAGEMVAVAGEPVAAPAGVSVQRLPIRFVSDDRRVITLPFMLGSQARVRAVFERLDHLDEAVVEQTLLQERQHYESRHRDILGSFQDHYRQGAELIGWKASWTAARCLLAGAYLTMEYAIDSAALFNPSIVPHPDQSGVPEGAARFIMSLRATGEGHISSIVFRTGLIHADQSVTVDPPARLLSRARMIPDQQYVKPLFARKLQEMAITNPTVDHVLDGLPEQFAFTQLQQAIRRQRPRYRHLPNARQTVDTLLWLACSNYHVELPAQADLSELVIFPMTVVESHGIEDLRLVRFVEQDDTVNYFGTYTAYNGDRILPMLVQTRDFHRLEVHSLNGACALNKGMALFPRRIGGHYAMCSRIDGENLFIMFSDYVHFWESAQRLAPPQAPWELMQIGNGGSPLETPEGWLLLTHGVGPMRTYSIGAMLLDLEDPLKVRGMLPTPLLTPIGDEREGYVPNVVYTCGAMIHRERLYLPYALADKSTSMAVIDLAELLNRLLESKPA